MVYFLLAFLVTYGLVKLLISTKLSEIALDRPNERSLHTQLTPRTGGLAVLAGILIAWFALSVDKYWLLLTFGLMAISLVDDIWNLSAKSRLIVQFLIVLICVLMMLQGASWLLIMPMVLLLTWMTNLYNFMDGSDGLAGGMGLFGFTAYAVAAYLAGNLHLALMCAAVSASCLAFSPPSSARPHLP